MTPFTALASDRLIAVATVAPSAAVAALAAVLVYALVCAASPYRVCPRCHGYSRLVPRRGRRPFGVTRPGRCPRCRGSGLRLRLGRRAWNHWARFRHARRSHRPDDRAGTF